VGALTGNLVYVLKFNVTVPDEPRIPFLMLCTVFLCIRNLVDGVHSNIIHVAKSGSQTNFFH
jgi:hypothetical protein